MEMYSGSCCLYKLKMHINPPAEWFRPVKSHALCTGPTQLAPTTAPATPALSKMLLLRFSHAVSAVPTGLSPAQGRPEGPQGHQRARRPALVGLHVALLCGTGSRFIHWIRKNGEVKGLAKSWVCQESLICKMKTEAVKSVDLNKL